MTRESLLAGIAVAILRLLFCTIRLKVDDDSIIKNDMSGKSIILCFWHNRILGITVSFLRRYPKQRKGVTVLTSPSKDGEILAQIMAGFRMGAIRGSSSRRGSQAMRELVRAVEQGIDIAVTPDGPRGPCYKLGPGVVFLAQTTGTRILPLHAKFSRCVRLKSWDRFIIPLPFSTISIKVGEPISVPSELTAEEFEKVRLDLENTLKNEAD
ncbi:hypothetical protein TSACC_21596 [Terrimicrobium sacchariphilum]|uniref:DUF374 domain-containing protein n=1 Tax=Terrimicrobium sacchariphilum TaxID=690879 RepID=A0A146G9A4_TERSA|nr:lysophospholipid acyltransferase family protein [Terrimicrobium sacchariphilum]GAT33186.1 hypothetical protein TSACC_21596 [Terrimicrobium sacchariphilum]